MHETFSVEQANNIVKAMNRIEFHPTMQCEEKNEYGKQHGLSYMQVNGEWQCTLCATRQFNKQAEAEETEKSINADRKRRTRALNELSVYRDNTLSGATFDKYMADNRFNDEVRANKQKAQQLAERLSNGEVLNVFIQSNETGVGKSHLAMAILEYVNSTPDAVAIGKECVFLEMANIYDLVLDSMGDDESKYTLMYFSEMAKRADLLVLDDLGAEIGNINTNKQASDFASRFFRSLVDARQDKSTIYTTNLSSAKLGEVYDRKVVSRVLRGTKAKNGFVIFNNTKDLRPVIDEIDFGF